MTDSLFLSRAHFGPDFTWGAATAAYQIEGAAAQDGRGPSIWDTFSHTSKKIRTGETGDVACDFYHRYEADIELLHRLGFRAFRFSLSWSRILPDGTTRAVNEAGLAFYERVIDKCRSLGIEPWVTLYHWDLPQALEKQGGWTNPAVVGWFSDYVDLCTRAFGNKVKHWMVLNEPLVYTAAGYFAGVHAPGRRGLGNFLPAVHHTVLCNAAGGRIIRRNVAGARIGTTLFCAPVEPVSREPKHVRAAARVDAMGNRLFIEPALGLGYPTDVMPALKQIERRYARPGDQDKLAFDFDFIGLQNYFRLVVRRSWWMPYLWAREVKPAERNVADKTEMGWEVYPEGMYTILRQFAQYDGIRELVITENGVAYPDQLVNGTVDDPQRTRFYQQYLAQVLRAKREGINVTGYFAWSLLDNFEWAEGYRTRFGLVYVDYPTQQRIVKASGRWFEEFLQGS